MRELLGYSPSRQRSHANAPGLANGPLRLELRRAVFLGYDSAGVDTAARLNAALGLGLTERNFQLVSENGVVVRELMRQGLGIGILPELLGDADPGLERVAVDLSPVSFPVWLVTHRDLRHSPRIRLVWDLLAEALGRA